MSTLTAAQVALLRSVAVDGTVLATGFNKTRHAIVTAQALVRRGLLTHVKHGRGYDIYRITAAGRSAVA